MAFKNRPGRPIKVGTTKKKARGKAKPDHPAKGKFLLQKKGRRKNTTGNARSGKSFVTTASKRKGFVTHVYRSASGKRVAVDVKKPGAKASPNPSSGGRTYKRRPKGKGGGQFAK